jgi:hypothetical protein
MDEFEEEKVVDDDEDVGEGMVTQRSNSHYQ